MVLPFRRVCFVAVGAMLGLASCSGGGAESADSTTRAETSAVVIETSAHDSLVADSSGSPDSVQDGAQTTNSSTTPPTTLAQTDRMSVAEAQVIVDDLNRKVGEAYRLAKQGNLAAARSKLAEAATGDHLAAAMPDFEQSGDLSGFRTDPGDPIYRVARVSDSKGSCATLAGVRDLADLFIDGDEQVYDAAIFLKREGDEWKFEFITESESDSDVLCS